MSCNSLPLSLTANLSLPPGQSLSKLLDPSISPLSPPTVNRPSPRPRPRPTPPRPRSPPTAVTPARILDRPCSLHPTAVDPRCLLLARERDGPLGLLIDHARCLLVDHARRPSPSDSDAVFVRHRLERATIEASSSYRVILSEAVSSSEQQLAITAPLIEKNGLLEDGQSSDDVIPFEGKEFPTDNDAYNYYNAYAKKIGFRIRKHTFKKSKKALGEILSRTFVCDKAGRKRASTEDASRLIINRRPETKVGCGAKMKIRLTSSKTWTVTKFISEHVHPFTKIERKRI